MAVLLEISITFDEFGWSELENEARAERVALNQLVGLACSYFASELAADRHATVVPRLGQPPAERIERETRTLKLELGDESLRRLEQDAERQGLPLERLCEHAALLYLADLDAGRVAERITGRADSDS
ncbi:MAG: hypothetical protein ACXWF9_08465 [Solirubrobacterales bacterium]